MPLVPLAPIARPIQGVRVQAAQQAVNTRADQQRVQAIQQAGGAVVGLLDRYNELTDTRNLVEAENEMRKATQDFNAWRLDPTNADESQWLPKWEETQAAVQKKFDGLKLSDRARLGLSRSFGQWSDGQTISLQGDVFKQGARRTSEALQLRVKQAVDSGDDALVSSSFDQMSKLGVMLRQEAENAKYDALKRSKATRVGMFQTELDTMLKDSASTFDDVRSKVEQNADLTDSEKSNILVQAENRFGIRGLEHLVYENPEHGLEAAQNDFQRGVITANQLDDLDKLAKSRKTQMRAEEFSSITDAMKGQKATPADLVAMIDGSRQLTDGDKAELMAVMDGVVDGPKRFSELRKEAANFQAAPDSPEYALFVARVDSQLAGRPKLRSDVLDALDKATGASGGDGSAFTRSFGKVFAFADDDLKQGVFGPTTGKLSDLQTQLPSNIRVQVDTFKNKILAANPKKADDKGFQDYAESKARDQWWNAQSEEKRGGAYTDFEIDDAAKSRSASILQTTAISELEAFRAAHPEKGPTELVSEYNRIVSKLRSASKLPPIAPSGGAAPTLPDINQKFNSIIKP